MSNVQHQLFGDVIVGNHLMPQQSGSSLHGMTPAQAASSPGTAEAPPLQKRLGLEPVDTRGLLPDLAGITILVTALGAYGGFW